MPNPTRLDLIEALDALERLKHAACRGGADWHSELWRNKVIKVIPAPPQPTMAEVEWDDDKHYLAEAEHQYCGKVVMLGPDEGGLIEFFVHKFRTSRYDAAHPSTLTLTGKRYTLTEVETHAS